MNNALLISAAVVLALSGSAFAKGKTHTSRGNDTTASTQQITEADCNTLTVDSARSSCMRSIHANAGGSHEMHHDMHTGATSGSGEGATGGTMTAKAKRTMHRMKDKVTHGDHSNASTQHEADVKNSADR